MRGGAEAAYTQRLEPWNARSTAPTEKTQMRPTKYLYHFVRGCGEIESENGTRILSSSCRRSGFLLRRGAPQSLAHAASSVIFRPVARAVPHGAPLCPLESPTHNDKPPFAHEQIAQRISIYFPPGVGLPVVAP